MPQLENSWQRTFVLFVAVLAILGTLLSILGGSEREVGGSLDETHRALSELLTEAASQFTVSSEQNIVGGTVPLESVTYLTGADNDPFLGSDTPLLTIVEFSDFECPFCRAAFPSIREFVSRHSDAVRYIYRDFPIEEIHEHARIAAEAAACANRQEKFWQYHDRLFQNQSDLSRDALLRYAESSGLDLEAFRGCITSGVVIDDIEEDLEVGKALGVRGTPTWFINGEKVEGVIPLEAWEELLTALQKTK